MIKRIRSWLAARRLGKEQEKQSHDFCHSAVVDRRHIWQMTAGTVGAVAIGSTALQAQTPGCTLSCRSTFELPVVNLPPLDVPVVWQRRHTQSGPPGATHGILALVAEATGDTSFPWPLYIQLTTSHNKGDAVGSTVRLTQLGNGWGAAFHTDVYHQGPSTSIGANIEITKKVDDGRAIGINIQSKGLTTDAAINIQTAPINPSSANAPPQPTGKWNTGIHLDANCKGGRGIWVEGSWDMGVDLGQNSFAMAAGSKLYLEGTQQVCMTFNADLNRIEFRNGDLVIGYLALDQDPHQL